MKKFFLFRSSGDKQVSEDHSSKSGLGDQKKNDECLRRSLLKNQKHEIDYPDLDNNSCLRRSRSFSSATFFGDAPIYGNPSCFSDHGSSPSSSDSAKAQHHQPPRSCCLTPERQAKVKRPQEVSLRADRGTHKRVPSFHSKEDYNDLSGDSSLSSGNFSNDVLDRYIDGEQNERDIHLRRTSSKAYTLKGCDKKPPRSHFTAPTSPNGSVKGKSRTSLRGSSRGSLVSYLSREWPETGFRQECAQDLAKHVAERLSRNQFSCRASSKDYDSDVPITIDDVYNGSLVKIPSERPGFEGDNADSEDDLDVELKCKLKEAQERILLLSEELEGDSIFGEVEFNVPALVQRIKQLTEEKVSLALDAASMLEHQLKDRASLKEQISAARLELESRTIRLEKERNEIQSVLEKELDRRSSDWSSKLEKCREEEKRLRDRVRELAEQNVSLQREKSSFQEKETDMRNAVSLSEKRVNDLTSMLEDVQRENRGLSETLCGLQDKYKVVEESRETILSSFEDREGECKELHVCVARLMRTCGEQEKTIDGLRGELAEMVHKRIPFESFDKCGQKLQMELVRLTGVEQGLRKEVDSCKIEADSLRRENINLLNRLKGCGNEGGSLTFKLDQEIWARVDCLQKLGLSSLNDCANLCSRLLDLMKRAGHHAVGKNEGVEVNGTRFDPQFVIESEVKVQGLKRGIETLSKGLQNIAMIMEEKSGLGNGGFGFQNDQNLKDQTRSELKAEKLLTSLLREKVYAKDREVEQLQAEVATAVRGNEILRCEIQNALDSLSCVTHRMKEFEIQMMKKDEKINQLEIELEERSKEVAILKGILPKVTEERDMMWQEVKNCSEKNMLLDSEVKMLKKKIEALDEDVLLKEGQISILKDTLGRKSFDLLSSPDRTHEFLVE